MGLSTCLGIERVMVAVLAGVLILATSGCALVFHGRESDVPIDSYPQGAEVIVDGVSRGTTPVSVRLAHDKDHTLIFRRAGFPDQTVAVERNLLVRYIVLDFVFALIPLLFDAATGAWYNPEPAYVNKWLPTDAEVQP